MPPFCLPRANSYLSVCLLHSRHDSKKTDAAYAEDCYTCPVNFHINASTGECECEDPYHYMHKLFGRERCLSYSSWLEFATMIYPFIFWGLPGWVSLLSLPVVAMLRVCRSRRRGKLVNEVKAALGKVDVSEYKRNNSPSLGSSWLELLSKPSGGQPFTHDALRAELAQGNTIFGAQQLAELDLPRITPDMYIEAGGKYYQASQAFDTTHAAQFRWTARATIGCCVFALPWYPALRTMYILAPYATMRLEGPSKKEPFFPPELRRRQLQKLRRQLLWVLPFAAFVFPPWLLAFTTAENGGFNLMWNFLFWEALIPNSCLRIADDTADAFKLESGRCHLTYHFFAETSVVQASILLLTGNLCVILLCQISGLRGLWIELEGDDDNAWQVYLPLLVGVVGASFVLPLLPIAILTGGKDITNFNVSQALNATDSYWEFELLTPERRIWVSIVMPICFACVIPLGFALWIHILARR